MSSNNSELLNLNVEILDYLRLLDYDGVNEFCTSELPPVHKSFFLSGLSNQALQFKYFTSLCAYLIQKITGREATWGKYDDPNTVTTNLIVLLKDIGLQVNVEIAPGKLKSVRVRSSCHASGFMDGPHASH